MSLPAARIDCLFAGGPAYQAAAQKRIEASDRISQLRNLRETDPECKGFEARRLIKLIRESVLPGLYEGWSEDGESIFRCRVGAVVYDQSATTNQQFVVPVEMLAKSKRGVVESIPLVVFLEPLSQEDVWVPAYWRIGD